jgi:cytochrome c nitrite reductase small subunit
MPRRLRHLPLPALALGLALGAAVGLGGFTFVYARGYSYLLDDPAACVNCHVMSPQFEGWLKGSHRAVATCNDCHTPHGFAAKYATKALNGWNHSLAFTTGEFPEPIRVTARNRRIAQESCEKCHGELVHAMAAAGAGEAPACVRCHGAVGHPG